MKWTNTPQGLIVDSYCNGNDGKNLGWVSDINDECAAYVCNGYESARYLGSFKTPRLAQQAVERELIKRWFKYEWGDNPWLLYAGHANSLEFKGDYYGEKERAQALARAKREFLNEL